ncbi:MAG: peptidylprolyl isomerase [Alphaproteobacteria bacterium]|nr:peptidylprolyl isomerase [Alphaproteobacteria bacterium]
MRFLSLFSGLLMLAGVTAAHAAPALDPENALLLQLKDGAVTIQLRPDMAPAHVARIKELARKGFYDGLVFHRVIEGFMAQTGDPTGTGAGGSDLPDLKAEFNSMKHVTGTMAMARAQSPDSANSQFFICFKPAPFLDGQYTAFGQVISGMEFINAIKKGDAANNGTVSNPDKIISLKVLADVNKARAGVTGTLVAPTSH